MLIESDGRVVEVPVFGRSFSLGQRYSHLWASFSAENQDTYADPVSGPQFFHDCQDLGPGLFQITTTAVSYIRNVGEVPTLPLANTANTQVPAGLNFTRRTQFQLRVFANDGVDIRQFDMDANQSVVVVAQDVCVAWLGPPGTQDVSVTAGSTRVGLVQDCFIGAALSRVEESPGNNSSVILTRHLYVPEETQLSVEIPSYATEVTIYQEPTLGNSAVMWTQTAGNLNSATGGMSMAALPFIPGQRRTQQQSILGNCTHLQSDVDSEERFFTLVWTIRP